MKSAQHREALEHAQPGMARLFVGPSVFSRRSAVCTPLPSFIRLCRELDDIADAPSGQRVTWMAISLTDC